ncbi:MAG: endonuclease/exonuclease/phosphatase family protein [Candidatus Nanopelagicales bacterium]
MTLRIRPWAAGLAAAGLLATILPAGAMTAQAAPREPARLSVMTQNLYLGSSLEPAVQAQDAREFLIAVATIYGTAVATDFPKRAQTIAKAIADERPDLIGLQEVTKWTATRTDGGPALPNYDFLEILMDALAAEGLDYSVAGVVSNASISAPLVNPALECDGAFPAFDCNATLLDRDAILVNNETGIKITPRSLATGRFKAQASLQTPLGPRSFDRGWLYVDMQYAGRDFRFANTHLEVETYASVQTRQAREFIQIVQKDRPGPVIAAGDFNSAADGSNTRSYAILTDYFADMWDEGRHGVGLTCCQDGPLQNTESEYTVRIDLVLGKGKVSSNWARVLTLPIEGAQALPLWGSDHGGVVAQVRLR